MSACYLLVKIFYIHRAIQLYSDLITVESAGKLLF